jgi:hypothetical protein
MPIRFIRATPLGRLALLFDDQAQRYADGRFRQVYFYTAELKGHVEKSYRPGE